MMPQSFCRLGHDKAAHPLIPTCPRTPSGAAAWPRPGCSGCAICGQPLDLAADARFATFGSCFATHQHRALAARKMGWVNGEPAPLARRPIWREFQLWRVFSARTANIYTAAQLQLLLQMVTGQAAPDLRRNLARRSSPQGFAAPAIET